ncbi:acrylyl-CoA reductase family protein [Shouchella shacheensis]|uniref:acrylyl-CoA reductase family protein n=1 Tax=Shouchella shacheensis TaxID=1649580 RepID=UPI00073FE3AE|nr:acryloyl-CoA reductase [Shouchella shacheensis]
MSFKAYVIRKEEETIKSAVETWEPQQLSEGEVTIAVSYSSVNYKDALVATQGKLADFFPLIPGIDLAGTVVKSEDERFKEGEAVIATSYRIGTGHHGGYSEMASIPGDWVVPLPDGLTLQEAMALGTAGLTAALSIQRLGDNGLTPEAGPVVVPGATGGVGSLAVHMLAGLGYEVTAGTGKKEEHDYLYGLGATHVVDRSELEDDGEQTVRTAKWAGAVDPVGGKTLSYILSTLKRGGSVATSGFTAGADVQTTVFPFIGRGVNWLGIDSVTCPMKERTRAWKRLGDDLKPTALEPVVQEVELEELDQVFAQILQGEVRGRTVVRF